MLHIIHPYTYKLKGKDLIVGPILENTSRDTQLSDLVSRALEYSYPVMCHERASGSFVEVAALKCDELFNPLFDYRVEWIGTDNYGYPLKDEMPKSMNEEDWNRILEVCITHPKLSEKINDINEVLICGGEFSRCERNFMKYIDVFHKGIDRRFYIPELSVVIDKDLQEDTTKDLEEIGFVPVSYEEALRIF